MDLFHRGYILLDVDAQRMQAEWYFTPSVRRQTSRELFGHALQTASGASRLQEVDQPSQPKPEAPLPAP